MPFPACEAVIEQVPPISSDAVLPDTVQTAGVVEANFTARPELAVADKTTDEPAEYVPMIAGNEMLWPVSTTKLVPTAVAAAYVAFPACNTSMEQVPVAMKEAVLPNTVHTAVVVDLKVTGRPELAVAARFSIVPFVCEAMCGKLMVWPAFVTVKLRETDGAAVAHYCICWVGGGGGGADVEPAAPVAPGSPWAPAAGTSCQIVPRLDGGSTWMLGVSAMYLEPLVEQAAQ